MYQVIPITGLPEFRPGDDLPGVLAERLNGAKPGLEVGDILVVTQKIVSKAEGRFVNLGDIEPSSDAVTLAAQVNKPPELVELVLRESSAVVRASANVLITRHRLGHVMANAGIDASNIGSQNGDKVLLLPQNPDKSAAEIADRCQSRCGISPGVIIADSFGRPWRIGTVNVAIGIHNVPAIVDQRGEPDRDGRIMQVTQIAFADTVSAAAGLAMGEGREGLPACIVRGLHWEKSLQSRTDLLRSEREDLFR
ncbi:MAG: coenzyme F420-0:L-glutamate ligase [Hirschia sp.]|nr:coenzyme F420-0:L-glutamate ligase [Hirschia sp.]MBF16781.1 coenzyme F420-0:L-glutamate ligase [Hirschia sp.]|tara:strand:+ start:399 stop:1154 length:756 start_codon:yes stop_codon:yes gene_type:complete